jgi:hypothetical protein
MTETNSASPTNGEHNNTFWDQNARRPVKEPTNKNKRATNPIAIQDAAKRLGQRQRTQQPQAPRYYEHWS